MDLFRSAQVYTTVLYFPLIDQKFVRKNDILQLTNGRCDQAEVDKVLEMIESECGYFEQKKRMLSRNRICISIFILCFVSGLTTVMISSGVNTDIGFYIGIAIVTLALLLVLLILLFNRMLNHVEEHYIKIIQSALERSNEKIEKGGVQWNTRAINLNYLELLVVEDYTVMKQVLGNLTKSQRHAAMIIEEDKNEAEPTTDRKRIPKANFIRGTSKSTHFKKATQNQRNNDSEEDSKDEDDENVDKEEEDEDDDDDDDDESDEDEDEDEDEDDEDESEDHHNEEEK